MPATPLIDVRAKFQGAYDTPRSSTTYIVVHHAAALYRTATGLEDVRSVHRYHRDSRGWPGIGYTEAIAEQVNGGPLARYRLSDLNLQRGHVMGRNHEAVGVACLTNFTGIPEAKWIEALADSLVDLLEHYPQARIVGHTEITIPGYATACPGPAWPLWRPQLLDLVGQRQRPTTAAITEHYRILGPNSITTNQALAFLLAQPGMAYREASLRNEILPAYEIECAAAGVDLGVAIAQLCHETGSLTSFWSQRPQRNPAGIGVTGHWRAGQATDPDPGPLWAYNTQRRRWEVGMSFPSWKDHAIPAHVWRLLGYAATDAQLTPSQRVRLASVTRDRPLPPSARGSALTLRELGAAHNRANVGKPRKQWTAGWAWDGVDYGQKLAHMLTRIRATSLP